MKQYQNKLDELRTEIENINSKMNILMSKLSNVVHQSTNYESSIIRHITSNFSNLLAALNTYPNLQANSVIMSYFKEVNNLESEVQLKLSEYNSIIKLYNDKVNNFPDMILAWIFRFKKKNYAKRK